MAISSPLDLTWDHAYWVEGPEFLAMYPAAVVTSARFSGYSSRGGPGPDFGFLNWPDEVGTADATIGAFGPTWTAADVNFGGKPSAAFPNGVIMESSNYASAISQPFELVVIGSILNDGPDNGRIFVGLNMATLQEGGSGINYDIWAGSYISTGNTLDHLPHVFDLQFDSTDVADVDGSTEASGNAGTNGWTKTSIGQGAGVSTYSTLVFAFIGIKSGLLSSGDRSDLVSWSQTHYATP